MNGYKKHNGRWMTEAQIGAENAELEAQKRADRHWHPLLVKWKESLEIKERHDLAEKHLTSVTDPRAVPSVWQILGTGSPAHQARAVQVLGQIEGVAASRALAVLAVAGKSPDVRRVASQTLARRDSREFVGLVIGFLRNPLNYEVRPVGGPGAPGVLFVEGERYNVRRLYAPPPLPADTLRRIEQRRSNVLVPLDLQERLLFSVAVGNGGFSVDPTALLVLSQVAAGPASAPANFSRATEATRLKQNTLNPPVSAAVVTSASSPLDISNFRRDTAVARNLAEAEKATLSAQQQLLNDLASIERYNAGVHQVNNQVMQVLNRVTGNNLGENREAWTAWWTDERGYSYEPPRQQEKPTYNQVVALDYTPSYTQVHHSCFGAGTVVRTLEGTRPIESLKVGDQVLTQNTQTAALSFQPILAVFHNRPALTVHVRFEEETIVVTGIHRFWRAGKGWVMARSLEAGDSIRTLGGQAEVIAVEGGAVERVYNLEVAEGQSFFVGTLGALVHDNSLVSPVQQPFDAAPELSPVKQGQPE